MNEENFAPPAIEQLLQNAEDYSLAMAAAPTPEQIENMRRRNEMFEKGLEICPNCERESRRKLENCEFCGQDKVPF
jgi:hypothetical protein